MLMNIWYIYSECCLTPKWENFQSYHSKNKLHFNEIMIMSVLYFWDMISCIFYSVSSLKQRADMSLNLDTVSRFRANSVKCDKLHMMMESRTNMTPRVMWLGSYELRSRLKKRIKFPIMSQTFNTYLHEIALPVSMLSFTIQFPVTKTASHCIKHPRRGISITSPGTRSSDVMSL